MGTKAKIRGGEGIGVIRGGVILSLTPRGVANVRSALVSTPSLCDALIAKTEFVSNIVHGLCVPIRE